MANLILVQIESSQIRDENEIDHHICCAVEKAK